MRSPSLPLLFRAAAGRVLPHGALHTCIQIPFNKQFHLSLLVPQPGVCFHMYSRQRSESLADFQLPELRRSPLDEMCLQVGWWQRGGGAACCCCHMRRGFWPEQCRCSKHQGVHIS